MELELPQLNKVVSYIHPDMQKKYRDQFNELAKSISLIPSSFQASSSTEEEKKEDSLPTLSKQLSRTLSKNQFILSAKIEQCHTIVEKLKSLRQLHDLAQAAKGEKSVEC